MLSVKECRKFLPGDFRDQEIEEKRARMYELAQLIIEQFTAEKERLRVKRLTVKVECEYETT